MFGRLCAVCFTACSSLRSSQVHIQAEQLSAVDSGSYRLSDYLAREVIPREDNQPYFQHLCSSQCWVLNIFFFSSKCLLSFGPDLNLIRKIKEGSKQLCKSCSRMGAIGMAILTGLTDSMPSLVQIPVRCSLEKETGTEWQETYRGGVTCCSLRNSCAGDRACNSACLT